MALFEHNVKSFTRHMNSVVATAAVLFIGGISMGIYTCGKYFINPNKSVANHDNFNNNQ